MCFAILRVTCKGDSKTESIDVLDEESMDTKFQELKNKDGVKSIKVYQISYGVERQEQWVATNT